MRFGRLGEPGTVTLEEREPPVAGPGEVTVRLAACGVCGTDLEKLRGNYRSAGVLGHEPVGRIDEVGAGVEALSPGDRVFVHHHVACLTCHYCLRGDYTLCEQFHNTNIIPGGLAERFKAPGPNVQIDTLRIPKQMSCEAATLIEPVAAVCEP